jgi:uncharacterized protein with FMN-binding domain
MPFHRDQKINGYSYGFSDINNYKHSIKGGIVLKKILKVILIVLLILILGFVGSFAFMIWGIQRDYKEIEPLRLDQTADGSHHGESGNFIVSTDLNVIVNDHKITDIIVVEQNCGPGYEALDTINRIIDKQEAKVDVVSGATWSSKSIMAATYDALGSE